MVKNPNKLIDEKSPYLLQHAYNPVNWYPWGDEAFENAKREDRPIFLSIGYSTCHWCHVMEKESFEDEEVAALMNENFISIKVDREERPDIDGIYMSVTQMMTGGGGWPMTVIMTPDKKPFFAGTYFPKHQKYNRIGMMELIPRLKDVWKNKRDEIVKASDDILLSLQTPLLQNQTNQLGLETLDKAYNELRKRFDRTNGGFGNQPKFPSPHNFLFLLRYWKRKNEPEALLMVEKTLTEMRKGGIYDQIGYGFARYSTDEKWLVPHFEKMLYDHALLAIAYTETYLATKNDFYKQTAEEILEYVLRDMTHPDGGFYSAEDADSEGEEGKFYLWSEKEIDNLFNKEDAAFAKRIFNTSFNGNWIDQMHDAADGTNILHLSKTFDELASEFNLPLSEFQTRFNLIRKPLFDFREQRIHPHKDDKILTDWNALMISAFAKTYQITSNKKFLIAAEIAAKFIQKILTDKEGFLLHRYRGGEAAIPAFLDDYTFLIQAYLDLYEASFNSGYLSEAVKLNQEMLEHFEDETNGGFYFTSYLNEKLPVRQKEIYDGAVPSGNSIALLNLLRLHKITNESSLELKAQKLVDYFSNLIYQRPSAYTQFLCGFDFAFGPSQEIIITTGSVPSANDFIDVIRNSFNPNKIILLIDKNENILSSISPYLKNYKIIKNKTAVYICQNLTCHEPVFTTDELKQIYK
jgi:uncharacterized protein YyaL (SSP411 family)